MPSLYHRYDVASKRGVVETPFTYLAAVATASEYRGAASALAGDKLRGGYAPERHAPALRSPECLFAPGSTPLSALTSRRRPVNTAVSFEDASIASRPKDLAAVSLKVVAGAAAGAIGVWALDRLDWFMWGQEDAQARAQTAAVRPGGEPPAQALVTNIENAAEKHLDQNTHEAGSQVVHYSIGIAPAIGYALMRDKLPMSGVARGALYGAGLFLTQDEVLNTITGLGAKPQDYPWQAHARGIIAHTAYGIVTELALEVVDQVRPSRRRVSDGAASLPEHPSQPFTGA